MPEPQRAADLDRQLGRVVVTPHGLARLLYYRLRAPGIGFAVVRMPDRSRVVYPLCEVYATTAASEQEYADQVARARLERKLHGILSTGQVFDREA